MANEITVTAKLVCVNGAASFKHEPLQFTVDQSTKGGSAGIQTIGTSAEALDVTDVAAVGWAFFTNVDTTNFVQIGPYVSATFYPLVKLKPGKSCVLPLDPTHPVYAKADTAPIKRQKCILEA